jgi:hypothetical protein
MEEIKETPPPSNTAGKLDKCCRELKRNEMMSTELIRYPETGRALCS